MKIEQAYIDIKENIMRVSILATKVNVSTKMMFLFESIFNKLHWQL